MGHTFISYSSKNRGDADALKALLDKNNIEVWMAPYDIPPGRRYAEVITRAVKNCSCLVLLLTDEAQNSDWVAKEVERAIHYKKTVIPIQLEDVVLNDEFEIYISSDQILPVKKIDESSEEIKSFIKAVKSYTGEVTEKEDSAEDAFSELKKDYIIEKRYRITDTLFKGRDYCVFLTLHEKTGRSCAVKAMSKPEDQAEAKRELTREIAFLNKLSHPNLSSVVDIIDTKEYLFAVMNFNEGMTLSEVVEAEGAQNEETVVRWAREICSALEYLHSLEPAAKANGITLSNILRDSSGKTSLMSYGIGGGASYGENTSYYLAPEISVGKADDGRGDIYSVGAVMYSLITGNDPDEEPHAVYPIRRANADVSEAFENIVAKCMDPDPNKRYGSISQLSKALEGLEKGKMTFKEKLAKLFKK